jgi:hypothetical protein
MNAPDAPPSRERWAIEGELVGHSVEQTLRYLSDCADYEDAQIRRRSLPIEFALADCEPRPVTWLRRLFGR